MPFGNCLNFWIFFKKKIIGVLWIKYFKLTNKYLSSIYFTRQLLNNESNELFRLWNSTSYTLNSLKVVEKIDRWSLIFIFGIYLGFEIFTTEYKQKCCFVIDSKVYCSYTDILNFQKNVNWFALKMSYSLTHIWVLVIFIGKMLLSVL